MHKYALIAIFCLACIGSCKEQNHAVGDPEIPVFSVSGLVNTTPLRLDAGVNNYYLYTTFSREANNVYVFGGELRPKDCNACGPSLSISFRNYTTAPSFRMDSAIVAGDYPYYDTRTPVETYYRLWCYSSASGLGTPAISWDFGNNRFSNEPNPVLTFPVAGVYPITCTAVFPAGCFSILNQPIFLTPTRVGKTIDFSVNYPDTHTVLFNSIPVDPNARVSWDFGDGQTALGTIAKHTYSSGAIYKVCMEYIKGSDTIQLCKNVNTMDISKCKTNFTFRSEMVIDSLHLSHVVVEWKDANGIVYSSGLTSQSSSNTFKVLGVKEYIPNEQGQKTRMITVLFSCSVSNGTSTITLNNITGTFAVAYP